MTTPRVPEERSATQPDPAAPAASTPAAASAAPAADERTGAPATAVIDERRDARGAGAVPADERDTLVHPVAPVGAAGPAASVTTATSPTTATESTDEHDHADPDAPTGSAARRAVVARQREAFGGVKIGSALFGWLAATGTAAILTGTVAGAATALGVDTSGRAAVLTGVESENVGWIAVAVLAAILLVSYWCGGYVAARMARFNGAVQGLAVWVWALVIAIVVSLVSVIIGSQADVLANANLYPRIRMSAEEFTVAGLVTAAVVLVSSLAGAVLGGMAGTRYHRRVDRAGFVEA